MQFPDSLIAEICGQPEALRRAAKAAREQASELGRLPSFGGQPLLFTGMGGSYDLCYAVVTELAGMGIPSMMVDAAELLHFRRRCIGDDTLLIMVSQSGETAEIVRLLGVLGQEGVRPRVVSVTNGLQNSLARAATVALDTRAGVEHGPSTMTFAAGLVLLSAVGAVLGGAGVDAALDRLEVEAARAAATVARLVDDPERQAARLRTWLGQRSTLSVLGRGAARAAAEMGALTLKEAAGFPAESIQSAQFRHGPLELVGRNSAVVLIATEGVTLELDLRLAGALVAGGTAVLLVSAEGPALDGVERIAIGELDRELAPAAAIVPLQLLAWRLAIDRGYRPGTYRIGSKVTTSE